MSKPSEILIDNLPAIEKIIAGICRRNGMDVDATEEFTAEVNLRLIRDDYAIIRAFGGRSRFSTYIAAVVRRLLLDHRNHEWGKWHDSAEALRRGDLAIDVERLIHRDRRSIEEALLLLAKRYPTVTRAEVEALVTVLPSRSRRSRVSIDEATSIAGPSEIVADASRAETASRISATVRKFIDGLPEADRLLMRLRFRAEMTVPQIAQSLHEDPQTLYRRLQRHFRELRRCLERAGIAAEDVHDLIGTDTVHLDFIGKSDAVRPSDADESTVAAGQEEISS